MESRSVCLRIQLGYPGRKHLFSKQRTSIANPRKRWNPVPVTLAQMPTILSSSCVLGVVDVVGKREDMSLFEKWQKIIDILKDILKPAPNSPAAGGDLTGFFSASCLIWVKVVQRETRLSSKVVKEWRTFVWLLCLMFHIVAKVGTLPIVAASLHHL